MNFKLILAFLLLSCSCTFSQVIGGELQASGRKLLTPYSFEIKTKVVGVQYFELSVNNEGDVIGIKQVDREGDIISTPNKIKAEKELYKLKFEAGKQYPKYHIVVVKMNFNSSSQTIPGG